MQVFGIVGHSGMGKTTLLERLIPARTTRANTRSTAFR
jgi:molybdopterin-guanine dinucleotide biosynthesis protein